MGSRPVTFRNLKFIFIRLFADGRIKYSFVMRLMTERGYGTRQPGLDAKVD